MGWPVFSLCPVTHQEVLEHSRRSPSARPTAGRPRAALGSTQGDDRCLFVRTYNAPVGNQELPRAGPERSAGVVGRAPVLARAPDGRARQVNGQHSKPSWAFAARRSPGAGAPQTPAANRHQAIPLRRGNTLETLQESPPPCEMARHIAQVLLRLLGLCSRPGRQGPAQDRGKLASCPDIGYMRRALSW
jgi:hypothetical protein